MKLNLKIQTIIINVGTPEAATLALLSALRYTNFPVKLIDCPAGKDAGEGNRDYFRRLQNDYAFELCTMPLDVHGRTIDKLFAETDYDYLLLLDSDAELLRDDFLMGMEQYIENGNCFGAGFVHGPCPMQEGSMRGARFLYYQERMYIPCTLLKVSAMRRALEAGKSFAARKVYTFGKEINSYYHPLMVYYDTGADIYCYLKYKCGMDFFGFPVAYHKACFAHYHGLTRSLLNSHDKNAASLTDVSDLIKNRLIKAYHFDISKGDGNTPFPSLLVAPPVEGACASTR